jgi:fatty-acyl-CoA synthase
MTDLYVRAILGSLSADPARVVVRRHELTMTGAALHAAILRTAHTLRDLAVGPGDTVAVLTEQNHPAMLVARYAAHLIGAAVVHIRSMNPRSDATQLAESIQAEILTVTGAQVLLTDEAEFDRAKRLAATPPVVVRLAGEMPEPLEFDWRPDDRAVVGFTSGSTGKPKLLDQSFRQWQTMVDLLAGDGPGPDVELLAVTPLGHTVGSMVDAVLSRGGTVALHEKFDASAVLRELTVRAVTDVYLAVPHLYGLLDHPDINRIDASTLRRVVYSGSPVAPHRAAHARQVFGAALIQVYGTAEAGGISSLSPLDHWEPALLGTVGRPFPWVDVRIGAGTTEPGVAGEVWVRSATVMTGYLDDSARTEHVLRDGWLRTGDIGCWDRCSYLRLVGRIGQVISSGGLKVAPASVEQALLAHPDVTNAAVYAIRDLDRVEYVHAAVELRTGAGCTPRQLHEHVARLLTPLHAPAAFTLWNRLPLDDQGKVDRSGLRSRPVTAFVTLAR